MEKRIFEEIVGWALYSGTVRTLREALEYRIP